MFANAVRKRQIMNAEMTKAGNDGLDVKLLDTLQRIVTKVLT